MTYNVRFHYHKVLTLSLPSVNLLMKQNSEKN